MALQRSPLYPIAAAAAAGFVERHGWELPTAYGDAAAEYAAVTSGAGLYDASHLGRLKASGDDALDLLHRLSTNNVAALEPGQGAPTILTTDRGRILDVVTVVHAGDHLLLLTSPGMAQAVMEFLDRYTIMEDMEVEDVSASLAMPSLWGPACGALLQSAGGASVSDLALHHSAEGEVSGCLVRIVAAAMGDVPGYYLISPAATVEDLWRGLLSAGATPLGEEGYELARIARGVPVYGSEMGEEYNPLEAGLIGSIDFTKGCYIGQEVIARLDTYQKVQKYLVKVAFDPQAAVWPGAVLTHEGKPVGKVTSVAHDPGLGTPIGLAYVRPGQALAGLQLALEAPARGAARVERLSQLFGPGLA
jgi:folate-binding protein YgfZ